MRRAFLLALAISAVPLWAATEVHQFEATLSPSNENPAVTNAAAIGEANIGIRVERAADGTITDAIVDFDLKVYLGAPQNLIALHIHRAAPGSNGPIVISSGGLDFSTDPVAATAGDVRIYRQNLANMDAGVLQAVAGIIANPGNYYVNLHSTANRSGLIRGQLHRTDAAMISMVGEQVAENADSIGVLAEMTTLIRTTVGGIARRLGLVPAQ
jgi:hypothetical protein